MKAKHVITQGEFLCYFYTFYPLLLREKFRDVKGEFCILILGNKVLKSVKNVTMDISF